MAWHALAIGLAMSMPLATAVDFPMPNVFLSVVFPLTFWLQLVPAGSNWFPGWVGDSTYVCKLLNCVE